MNFDFKVSLNLSSSTERLPGKGVTGMSNKLDMALNNALRQNALDRKNVESKDAQAEHLWERLKEEMQQGSERINGDPARVSLVGGKLEYSEVDSTGYRSDDMFQIKNVTIPCLVLKVKNCREFLAVELRRRYELRGEIHPRELNAEELNFMIDKSGYLFTRAIETDPKMYDAETLSVYLFENFWNPSYRE